MEVLYRVFNSSVHFRCLKELHYYCNSDRDGHICLGPGFTATTFPALEHLSLDEWGGSIITNYTRSLDCGPINYGQGRRSRPQFPWPQLRFLYLRDATTDYGSILRLLQACSALTHFCLASAENPEAEIPAPDQEVDQDMVVHMERLVQLEIDLDGYGMNESNFTYMNIFRSISAPKLHTLAIDVCGHLDRLASTDDFIARSGCKARCLDLSISGVRYPGARIAKFLRFSIVSLQI